MTNDEPTTDQIDELDRLTFEAMLVARDVFEKHLSDSGYDPAYWDIFITVWQKDSSLSKRLRRFEYEGEVKQDGDEKIKT